MKKEILILNLIFLCLFTISCSQIKNQNCDLFPEEGPVRDTIVLDAQFTGTVKFVEGGKTLSYLENNNVFKRGEISGSITFIPKNCTKQYSFDTSDKSKIAEDIYSRHKNQLITVTCIVFRDKKIPLYYKGPLVIVTKVRLAE